MAMTRNELKATIAEILSEAKKKKAKAEKLKKTGGRAAAAYGYYDEALDFTDPLGAANRYYQQGGVNWGPMTSGAGLKESEETALRATVREVLENGLIPEESAWAPVLEGSRPQYFESTWEQALWEAKHWYDRKSAEGDCGDAPKKGKGADKTKYGQVKKHGQEPKKGKK
jgi:hypothetical protein